MARSGQPRRGLAEVLLAAAALLAGVAVVAAILPAGPAYARASSTRTWKLTITAPTQFDLALEEVEFHKRLHGPHRGLRFAFASGTGSDYLVAAVPRFRIPGGDRALVLAVDRRPEGSPVFDPATVAITLRGPRGVGNPITFALRDPFTVPPAVGLTPALCDLPIRGPALTGTDLRAVAQVGERLPGFGASAAVAQAYDAVCGRPFSPSFRQAVTQGSTACGSQAGAGAICCPPNAICATPPPAPPSPTPAPVPAPVPNPEPPHCTPCPPEPGHACPLSATPSVCVASVLGPERRG